MSDMETDAKEPAAEAEEGSNSGPGSPPVSSPQENIAHVPPQIPTPTSSSSSPSFSQLLAGAMSPRGAQPMVAVPIDGGVGLPMVAVPCFLAPASLLDSPGFKGQFAMTHQAVLATVTAQAQMQLQTAYSSSPEVLSSVTPVPLQSQPSSAPEENVSTPDAEQPLPSDQKSPSTQVMKTGSTDGYNWRKYGQKQVKSTVRSRSYYKCTNVSCLAKKKVERCPDGRETEIIYRGNHNHDPPQKTRCSKERVQSGGLFGENECLDLPTSEVNESDPSTLNIEQNSGTETPEQQLYCSSDCEGDAAVKTEEDRSDEPDPKRRLSESSVPFSAPVLKTIKEPKIVVQSASEAGRIDDGYRWRKYGQKIVKGNPNPRSYYRCTHDGCPVRKHVERASDDAKAIIITYEGKHNHSQPPPKSGSDQPSRALVATAVAATNAVPLQAFNPLDQKDPAEGKPNGNNALELGGEKTLESAQTLLRIGFTSTSSGEEGPGTNSDGMNCPLFDEKCAAVPVQNS